MVAKNGTVTGEAINEALAQHQVKAEDWALRTLLKDLHSWAERMIVEFKLQVGTPALMVDQLSRRRYGHFRYGRNGFGLSDEIAINARWVNGRPYWQVLGTLLHELVHSWQSHHGKPGRRNFHNRAPSPFLDLLAREKVDLPEVPKPQLRAALPRRLRRSSGSAPAASRSAWAGASSTPAASTARATSSSRGRGPRGEQEQGLGAAGKGLDEARRVR